MSRAALKKRIHEMDFAIHELSLYLDTHPTCKKGMALLAEYRKKRRELIAAYEERFGNYILTSDDAPASGCWAWLDGPWPWENNFLEG